VQLQRSDKCRRTPGSHYWPATIIFSVLLHLGVAAWWLNRSAQPLQMTGVQAVTVDLIALAPTVPEPAPQVAQPQPLPSVPEPLRDDEMAEKRRVVKKKLDEVKRQTSPVPVQEQPTAPVSTAEPQPAPVAVARYDADYLNNPPPGYPQQSRRLGEEGQVLIRVQVSADGKVLSVELKQSSGFERLDQAALKAVAKYRFTAIGHVSSVVVPVKFKLKN
jgi:protein TonB